MDASQIPAPTDVLEELSDEESDALVGTTLGGRYYVIRRIGEGGMGIVYEVKHTIIEKRMALKVLRADSSKRSDVVQRFRQEAKSASLIGHEHIVDISDFGETPTGQHYFVMEMLDGEDLANVLAADVCLDIKRALIIAHQCCCALGAAHAKGIVHRDMKPENIFLTRRNGLDDFVKIVDFGIAKMSDLDGSGGSVRKLTKTGMIFGTPEYMSPEQAAGKELDHRVDIYAMGVILYEMVTGRVPFIGENFMGILTQHMFEVPMPMLEANPECEASPLLEELIMQALAKNPDERFQSMDELAEAISYQIDFLEDETAVGARGPVRSFSARRQSLPHRMSQPSFGGRSVSDGGAVSKKRPWLIASIGLATVCASAAVAYVTLGNKTDDAATSPNIVASTEPDRQPSALAQDEAAENAAAKPAQPETVEVTVETSPAGATVSIEGQGVVCEGEPCNFVAEPGKTINLSAEHNGATAQRTLTPKQSTTLFLALQTPAKKPAKRRSPQSPKPARTRAKAQKSSGESAADLKRPDFF